MSALLEDLLTVLLLLLISLADPLVGSCWFELAEFVLLTLTVDALLLPLLLLNWTQRTVLINNVHTAGWQSLGQISLNETRRPESRWCYCVCGTESRTPITPIDSDIVTYHWRALVVVFSKNSSAFNNLVVCQCQPRQSLHMYWRTNCVL